MPTFHLFIPIYHVLGFINTSLVCFNSSDIKIGSSKAFITFNWKQEFHNQEFHNQNVKYPKYMILRRHRNYIAFFSRKIKHLYDLLKTSSRPLKHAFANI